MLLTAMSASDVQELDRNRKLLFQMSTAINLMSCVTNNRSVASERKDFVEAEDLSDFTHVITKPDTDSLRQYSICSY